MPSPREIMEHKPSQPPPGQSTFLPGKEPVPGVQVVRYDPTWPQKYRELEELVRNALGDRVLEIDHVGSTAVPGLAAKPVIDIALIVADSADEAAWVPDLEAKDFDLVIREPWWYEHRALVHPQPRCNLHVYGPEAAEPVRQRIFRDWLTEHPDDLALYQQAKLESAEAANAAGEHVMQYNSRKEQVIRNIYARAFHAAGWV